MRCFEEIKGEIDTNNGKLGNNIIINRFVILKLDKMPCKKRYGLDYRLWF